MTKTAPQRISDHRRSSKWPALAAAAAAATAALALAVQKRARDAEARHPPGGDFLHVDGVDLHYTDSGGENPAVVLFHGNGAMIQDLDISGLVDTLSAKHRVIVFDRPGYGYSSRPRQVAWTPQAQAVLFHRALARLGIERPIVLGHSWGTLVALAMASMYPSQVSGLALVSGYYFPTARPDAALLSGPAIPLIGDLWRYTGAPFVGDLIAPAAIRKMFEPLPVSEAFMRRFPLDLALRPSQIRASSEEAAMMVPAAERLKDFYGLLDMPVVIIAGAGDQISDPQRQAEQLHHAIPGSRLMVFPQAGHMVHHAVPEDIAEAVRALADERQPASVVRPMQQSEPAFS